MNPVTPAKNKRKRCKGVDEIIDSYDGEEHGTKYSDSDREESSSEDEESVECTPGRESKKKSRRGVEKDRGASYWKEKFNEAASLRRQAEDRAKAAEEARRSLQKDMGILKESKKKKKDASDVFHARMVKEARAFVRYKMGRIEKFFGPHHKMWSTNKNTLCGMTIEAIHWDHDKKHDDVHKRLVWETILSHKMNPLLGEHKNKIHQKMRETYNSK